MLRFLLPLALGLVVLGACGGDETTSDEVPNPGGKKAGAKCKEDDECQSLECKSGRCTSTAPGEPDDGIKNGDETDIDCGGTEAPKCAVGKDCLEGTDCESASCRDGTCRAPAPDDGIKNGDETDVDCGGAEAPKCATGKGCAKHADCTSDACSYAKTCVEFKSCTGHFGGDTCGTGETGAADAKHESCCATVTNDDGLKIGKYLITAGRMRALAERLNGNIRQWALSNPTGISADPDELPSTMDEVDGTFGPNTKRGCFISGSGGGSRTWWQEPISSSEKTDFSKDVLDEKPLNCFPWYMAEVLCAYDGGRLPTNDEVNQYASNDFQHTWPWQFRDQTPYSVGAQDDRLNHRRNYATPNPPADLRTIVIAGNDEPRDRSFFISPPGRFPGSANADGVQDAVGNLLVWVADQRNAFNYTVSWEDHDRKTARQQWTNNADERDGYYAIGARCVFDE